MSGSLIPQMLRDRNVHSLWSIQTVENLSSILRHGILSRALVDKRELVHADIANQEVNVRRGPRRRVSVKGWYFSPHEYVPLFMASNSPMLYVSVRDYGENIVLLEVDIEVSSTLKSLFTDGNLAARETTVYDDPLYCNQLDWPTILFGDGANWSEKRKKGAEVLIPDVVEPKFIRAIHVLQLCAAEKMFRANTIVQESGRSDLVIQRDLWMEGLSK